MQLRSDIHSSDDYLKIMYVSPNLSGLHLAVSFAPDGSRDLNELFGDDQRNEQANIWDIAANYLRTVGDVDFGLSIGYVTGENVNNDTPGTFADLEEWGAAAKLAYRELTVGVAYRQTNVAGGGPIVSGPFISNVLEDVTTDIWSIGATYETGPWAFGVNYVIANEEVLFSTDQEGRGLQFAAAYTIDENFRVSAGYQHFEFEGPNGNCPTDAGGGFFGCDTLDGNVGYLETTFIF
jgi:predicted porin